MRGGAGVAVLISLFALACGGSGSGSGSSATASSVTRGAQCEQLQQSFCARASGACQLFPAAQVSDCVQTGKTSCCSGNCGGVALSTQQDIDTCIGDIGAADCSALDTAHGGTLPQTCQRLVTSALSR
jgi:hypothetical protein